jgi:hypothetical protein
VLKKNLKMLSVFKDIVPHFFSTAACNKAYGTEQNHRARSQSKTMSEEEEPTFAEAFADVEASPDLEATLLERFPELQIEEARFPDVEVMEPQGNFSHGITYERRGDGDGTITFLVPDPNNPMLNPTEGHLSCHERYMYMGQLETALVTTNNPASNDRDEDWIEQILGAVRADINNEDLTRNQLHFGQAHGTPFTLPLFTKKIGWQASTPTAELILDGKYEDSELLDLQVLLVKHCQSQHVDALPSLITEEEFVSKFKGWKEGTSTSPSGLHLGHYKPLVLQHDGDPTTDKGKAIESQRKDLIRAHVGMINYGLRHAYSYARWKNVVNKMIEKEPGNSKVHLLRVIHIYKADYNFLLQAKWRNMISHAETNHLLHPGQYGSRPGRDALIPALIEELKNEICYASRKSLINFDNDATSCYDRIIPALVSLIGQKFGLHRNMVFVHATMLEETKYKLKTSMGVSDEFYKNCQAFPIYGTGQGSGNSPVIWCIVSSVLFSLMHIFVRLTKKCPFLCL